jgi:hypothetical protein
MMSLVIMMGKVSQGSLKIKYKMGFAVIRKGLKRGGHKNLDTSFSSKETGRGQAERWSFFCTSPSRP